MVNVTVIVVALIVTLAPLAGCGGDAKDEREPEPADPAYQSGEWCQPVTKEGNRCNQPDVSCTLMADECKTCGYTCTNEVWVFDCRSNGGPSYCG